jgi:hypothetical protein
MTNHSMKQRRRTPLRIREVPPLRVEASLRSWCVAALNSAPGGVLSLERLRDICRGSAAAEGEADVEPIDLGRVALALADEADWEIVCRPLQTRRRG